MSDSSNHGDELLSAAQILAQSGSVQPPTRVKIIDLTNDSADENTETTSSSSAHPELFPIFSSDESTTINRESFQRCSAAASQGRKRGPWKKMAPWSLIYQRHQRDLNSLRADTDNINDSLEILETPKVTPDNLRRQAGDDNPDWEIQASYVVPTITRDRVLGGEPSISENSHEGRDAGLAEVAKLQRINHTESVFDTSGSDEFPMSVAEPSGHNIGPATTSALMVSDLGDDTLAMG